MSDLNRPADDTERLPWLEAADEYEEDDGAPIIRLIAAVIVCLVAIGLIVGGVFWIKNRPPSGEGGTITAQPGPYKVKPDQPGGMHVEGTGDVAYGASEGKDGNSTIDLSAMTEEPVKGNAAPNATAADAANGSKIIADAAAVKKVPLPPSQPQPAPQPAKTTASAPIATAKPQPKPPVSILPAPAPAPAATGGSGVIQLGALDSNATANKAWSSLSSRFNFLSGLDHSVQVAQVNGKTYYRLRANAGGDASKICAKLKVAGEACTVVHE